MKTKNKTTMKQKDKTTIEDKRLKANDNKWKKKIREFRKQWIYLTTKTKMPLKTFEMLYSNLLKQQDETKS